MLKIRWLDDTIEIEKLKFQKTWAYIYLLRDRRSARKPLPWVRPSPKQYKETKISDRDTNLTNPVIVNLQLRKQGWF